jgi:cell division protein FtsW
VGSVTRTRPRRPAPPHLRVVGPDESPPRTVRDRRTGDPSHAPGGRTDRAVRLLLASTLSLTIIGLVMVLSASSVSAFARYGSSFFFFRRQLLYAVVGAAVLWLTSRMRYRAWERLAAPLLVFAVVLLGLVLHPAAGTVAGGSARWLVVGPVTVQPSELAKLAVIAFASALLARRWHHLHDVGRLTMPLLPVVGLVCALIMLQPDLGTTVVLAGAVFGLLFVAGARLRHLFLGVVGSASLGFALISVKEYQWNRFIAFLNPWADPQGAGYQIIQSMIALASGGPLGVGLGASRQKWLYVPNAHTDFIFSIIGEELGLVGNLAILALFGTFIYAGIRIAMRAPDAFGRFMAAGITAWIGFQAIVNLGAVTGLLPITGVPLPFVSFGGSALVVSLAGVGILVSIGRWGSPARAGGRRDGARTPS